jgi:RNA polymerase sigma-70 factor (ECF subfamily)
MEERQAIARLQRGDIGGLELLVRRYQVRAVRAAYLIVRDRHLAEDTVQAAFIRAYERIHQFDPARPFGPWFLRSVVNDAIKAAGRRERLVPLESLVDDREDTLGDLLTDPDLGPEGLAEQGESREAIWAALGELSPAQRAVIVQRYYLDLSEAEMAGALDCPPGTVKWRLHAARTRLRLLLRPIQISEVDQ